MLDNLKQHFACTKHARIQEALSEGSNLDNVSFFFVHERGDDGVPMIDQH